MCPFSCVFFSVKFPFDKHLLCEPNAVATKRVSIEMIDDLVIVCLSKVAIRFSLSLGLLCALPLCPSLCLSLFLLQFIIMFNLIRNINNLQVIRCDRHIAHSVECIIEWRQYYLTLSTGCVCWRRRRWWCERVYVCLLARLVNSYALPITMIESVTVSEFTKWLVRHSNSNLVQTYQLNIEKKTRNNTHMTNKKAEKKQQRWFSFGCSCKRATGNVHCMMHD